MVLFYQKPPGKPAEYFYPPDLSMETTSSCGIQVKGKQGRSLLLITAGPSAGRSIDVAAELVEFGHVAELAPGEILAGSVGEIVDVLQDIEVLVLLAGNAQ